MTGQLLPPKVYEVTRRKTDIELAGISRGHGYHDLTGYPSHILNRSLHALKREHHVHEYTR